MASNPPRYDANKGEMKDLDEGVEHYEDMLDSDKKAFADGLTMDYKLSRFQESGWIPRLSLIIQVVTFLLVIVCIGVAAATLHKTYDDTPVAAEDSGNADSTNSALTGSDDAFVAELARNNTWLQNQILLLLNVTQGIQGTVSEPDMTMMEEQLNYTDMLNQVIQTTQDTADQLNSVVSTLSNLEQNDISMSAAINNILGVVEELLRLQNASVLFNSITPVSCQDIKKVLPNSQSGYYHVNSRNIYCNMEEICGSDDGWTRLAYLDMADSVQECPSGFVFGTFGSTRACHRPGYSGSCSSVSFEAYGITYSEVCGKVEAFQRGHTDAISPGNQGRGIDSYYVDGISITRGSPRKHVWTLMAGLYENYNSPTDTCPCYPGSTITIKPTFIGDDYYCESGNPKNYYDLTAYPNDVLWDGKDCTSFETNCCNNPNLPWFHKQLGTNTTDYIELRLCGDESPYVDGVPITYYEIYVK